MSGILLTYQITSTLPSVKYYYFGSQRVAMRQGNEVYYLHGDHLGSTSLTTNLTGTVVAQTRHHPFGEVRWESGVNVTDFGFTGQRNEVGFGLMDYNARFYSAGLGRFISADSIVPDFGNSQGLNRYSYVYNNPLRYIDPSGHQTEGWEKVQNGIQKLANRLRFYQTVQKAKATQAMRIMIYREQSPDDRAMKAAANILWNDANGEISNVIPILETGKYQGYPKGPPSQEKLAQYGEKEEWDIAYSTAKGIISGDQNYADETVGAHYFANILESEEETYKSTLARGLQEKHFATGGEFISTDDILTQAGYNSFRHELPTSTGETVLFVYNRELPIGVLPTLIVTEPKEPWTEETWGQ